MNREARKNSAMLACELFETDKLRISLGLISPMISAPFYRLQFLLQTQREAQRQGIHNRPYAGVWDVLKQTITNPKREVIWRGFTSTVFINVLQINVHGQLYTALCPRARKNDNTLTAFAKLYGAGLATSALTSLLTHPLDYHRTRVQFPLPFVVPRPTSSTFLSRLTYAPAESALSLGKYTVLHDGGFPSLYRALSLTFLTSAIYHAAYLPVFYTLTNFEENNAEMLTISILAASLSAGLLTYPFDTVRRRLFLTNLNNRKYANCRSALVSIVRDEGFLSLYRGYSFFNIHTLFACYCFFVGLKIRSLS